MVRGGRRGSANRYGARVGRREDANDFTREGVPGTPATLCFGHAGYFMDRGNKVREVPSRRRGTLYNNLGDLMNSPHNVKDIDPSCICTLTKITLET